MMMQQEFAGFQITKGNSVQKTSGNETSEKKTANAEFGESVALVLFFWLTAIVVVSVGSMSKWSLASSGEYGDSFGALNCLFTGFAAAGAYAAFKSQQRAIQRIQDDQRRDAAIQRFHELLKHWRTAVADVQICENGSSKLRIGVDAIMMIENEFLGTIYALKNSVHKMDYKVNQGQRAL